MIIKMKTISCHYDPIYCLEHNNRDIISSNVDVSRTINNYNCVVSGGEVLLDYEIPMYWPDIRKEYRILVRLYRKKQAATEAKMRSEYWDQVRRFERLRIDRYEELGLKCKQLELIFSPLGFIERIQREVQYLEEMRKLEYELRDQEIAMILHETLKDAHMNSVRLGLWEYDRANETHYLEQMDRAITKMAQYVEDFDNVELRHQSKDDILHRFATIDEIYDRVYEPSFREFQDRQRPCRRYEGTYLEQIREGQAREHNKKQQNKNSKCRTPAEAIEFVIGIGDMDNTGYLCASEDSYKSEILLKDYCDYLLTKAPNVCVVTTKELDDPNWQPPFNNGLLILNLVVHADEATPGIHLTCIPYSRGCKRGPAVQASLGRAMAGLGYPSTWKDVLDENGERIPKRNRNGEIVLNKDGSVRYQQEPDKQGIIDWIEEQKQWLQAEMLRRYDWHREYKGSHPRGNLSIPDYKVARALERQAEIEQQVISVVRKAEDRIENICRRLDCSADTIYMNGDSISLVANYINTCSDEEYEEIVAKAAEYMKNMSANEKGLVYQALSDIIKSANMKQQEQLATTKDAKQHMR